MLPRLCVQCFVKDQTFFLQGVTQEVHDIMENADDKSVQLVCRLTPPSATT
jgi:hypothetical protein